MSTQQRAEYAKMLRRGVELFDDNKLSRAMSIRLAEFLEADVKTANENAELETRRRQVKAMTDWLDEHARDVWSRGLAEVFVKATNGKETPG